MSWDIPLPYAVNHPKPLGWAVWWRVFSLLVMLCIAIGCGLWFWLKDPRLLLLTFVTVIGVAMLFGLIAGWRLFAYGVDAERADELADHNDWHKAEWQEWAQTGLDVVDYSYIFPSEVPHPREWRKEVNSEQAFTLGECPPLGYLFEELLAPLKVALSALSMPLTVYLPCANDESTQAAFLLAWGQLGLPASRIVGYVNGAMHVPFAERVRLWLDTPDSNAKLMIFCQWEDSEFHSDTTDGAVAWLIAPVGQDVLYRCRLHRPMTGQSDEAEHDAAQFLKYQPVAMTTSDMWFNEPALAAKDTLVIKRCQRMREADPTSNPGSPVQHFIPHWLGKPGPASDWFTFTLMMQMAEYQHTAQGLVLSQNGALLLATVSPGELTRD